MAVAHWPWTRSAQGLDSSSRLAFPGWPFWAGLSWQASLGWPLLAGLSAGLSAGLLACLSAGLTGLAFPGWPFWAGRRDRQALIFHIPCITPDRYISLPEKPLHFLPMLESQKKTTSCGVWESRRRAAAGALTMTHDRRADAHRRWVV